MRECKKCHQIKADTEYYNDSKGRLASYCKACAIEDSKASYQRRKDTYIPYVKRLKQEKKLAYTKFVNDIKMQLGCCFCGENSHPSCLDCHHLEPDKKEKEISILINGSATAQRLLDELVKCVVVCATCHRKIHLGLLAPTVQNIIKLDGKDLLLWENPKGFRCRAVKKPRRVTRVIDGSKIRVDKNTPKQPVIRATKIVWPSKDELEKLIWLAPMTQLAVKLGVTDRAIKKHCNKLGIICPPTGYWAKK